MKKNLILFIEDEELPNVVYIRRLKSLGFDVKQVVDPELAFQECEKHRAEIAAVILDIMMPPGSRYTAEETQKGLTTGILLFRDLRRLSKSIPIIVLTNFPGPAQHFPESSDSRLRVFNKLSCTPRQLGKHLGELLEGLDRGL